MQESTFNTKLYYESIVEYCQTEAEATRLNLILEEVNGGAPYTKEALRCLAQDYGGNLDKLESAAFIQAAIADDALRDVFEHGSAAGIRFFAGPLNRFRLLAQRPDAYQDFCVFATDFAKERLARLDRGEAIAPVELDEITDGYGLKNNANGKIAGPKPKDPK